MLSGVGTIGPEQRFIDSMLSHFLGLLPFVETGAIARSLDCLAGDQLGKQSFLLG